MSSVLPGDPDDARPTEPKRAESSLGDLVTEMTTELGDLMRQEIELAKTEARDELGRAGRAAGMLAAAGVAGWLAVLFVSLALAWLLDQGLNRALSFLIVAVVWAIGALVMQSAGRRRLKSLRGLPETRRSVKEDMEWARAQRT